MSSTGSSKNRRGKNDKNSWRSVFIKLPWLLLIPLGFAMPLFATKLTSFIDGYYAESLFPALSSVLQTITAFLPFSLAEFLIIIVVLGVSALIITLVVRLIMRKTKPARFISALLTIAIVAGVMLNMFYVLWGFNYYSSTLDTKLELDVHPRSTEELQEVSFYLVGQANELRESVPVNADGVYESVADYTELQRCVAASYAELAEAFPVFEGNVGNVKGVVFSRAMSYAGISGIYIPFTAEPNVNIDQPSLLILSSSAHEAAHQLGFARENEANFIAYLAGAHSNSTELRYSTTMLALINCTNKLYEADADMYFEVYAQYSDGLKKDLANYNEYWKQFDGSVEEAFNDLNDNYLQFHNQESGVKSYGEMVDLLLAYYYEHILPAA
ncbi:MAG: DUF3810 domain-containing protein [Clostridia bacterium]|nr:DUF3810 domain-containing protein [Clostridia bacterium]